MRSSRGSVHFLTSGHLFIVATLEFGAIARRSSDPLVYLRRERPAAGCDTYIDLVGQLIWDHLILFGCRGVGVAPFMGKRIPHGDILLPDGDVPGGRSAEQDNPYRSSTARFLHYLTR